MIAQEAARSKWPYNEAKPALDRSNAGFYPVTKDCFSPALGAF